MSGSSVKEQTGRYSNTKIEDNAKKYGYKAANLINIQDIIQEFNQSNEAEELGKLYGKIHIGVPNFNPIDYEVIRKHLDTYSPIWQDQFKQFQEAFYSQQNQGNLGEEAKRFLKELQATIINCFKEHPLSGEMIDQFLQDNQIESGSLLMIRSTGIHEDRADMANPGGNESVPCRATTKDISEALGIVAASYIGEKSLSQRLGAGDKSIAEMPVMPGLIQKMIGEGLDNSQVVSSGVVYTNGGSTRMQVAPGHGEYVVNSKGKVDNYYISSEGIVYSEIANKDFRLAANVNIGGDRPVSLERKDNDPELKYSSAIDPESSIYLHELSKFIERKYGNRVDIEFVYKPASQTEPASINIVQVRAIPEGNRRGLEPSTLSPKFLGENKDKLQTINGLQVITPEVNRAAIVNNSKQVIITSNIEQALSEYNKLGQNGRTTIKAVIVQTPAPDTSHEAGVFNAGGIAVMQVKDIEEFRRLIPAAKQQALIVDPQHSKIYQLPQDLGTNEQKLYEQEILAKGIYASALSNYVTPINYDFSKVQREELSAQPINTETILQDKTLGTLIAEAKQGNKGSLDKLLSAAYKVVSYGQEKKQREDKAQILHDNLDVLASPKIGGDNNHLREALGYNLRATVDSYKKGYISHETFKQTVIAGTELSVLLDRMEKQGPAGLDKEQQDKIYLEYFNVQKKFSGLNINLLAASIQNYKYQELAEKLNPKIEGENKKYLIESLKLGDYLISKEQRNNWNKFCADICTTREGAKCLGTLVNKLVSYKAHEQWINYIFTETNDPKQPQQTLNKLEEDFTKVDLGKIKTASDIIKSMDSQIPEWSNPAKFDILYKDLQSNLITINDNLKWNKDATNLEKILILQQIHQLVDVMDKSIKSLECSNQYTDDMQDAKGNDLQVARFRDMVEQSHDKVMVVWVKNAEFKREASYDNQSIDMEMKQLRDRLDIISNNKLGKNQLTPSNNFSVNQATINNPYNSKSRPHSLEDFFTLIHQNLLLSIGHIYEKIDNKRFIQQYPKLVQILDKEFNSKITDRNNLIIPSTITKFDDKKLVINKNFPLSEHSIIAEIRCDIKTSNTSVKFHMFAENEWNRNTHIALDNYLDFSKAGCSFTSIPYFDQNKKMVTFEVKVENEQQIKCVVNEINKSIKTSFLMSSVTGSWLAESILNERLEALNALDSANPEISTNIEPIPDLPIKWPTFKGISQKGKNIIYKHTRNFKYLTEGDGIIKPILMNIQFTEQQLMDLINNGIDLYDWPEKLSSPQQAVEKSKPKIPPKPEIGLHTKKLLAKNNNPSSLSK